MDELKHRAGEKLEALHVAAKTAADSSRSRVEDVYNHTSEAIRKIREVFHELWHNELIAEGRSRIVAWSRDAVHRIKEGAPPLSPVVLYEELLTLFHDRVWRRSMLIFAMGVVVGGSTGLVIGLRVAGGSAPGPHARALHTNPDQTVILVEDAVASSAGAGEVLVRVQAFSTGAADRAALRGRARALRALLAARSHVTVGRGFAGVVLDVGHGVTDLELGDEVWGCVSEWNGGAASELLTIRSTRVSKRPRSLSADSAAALPWPATEALAALAALSYTRDNTKGKRVAICGAASGEGCALVQLLSAWGAHVSVLAHRHAALTLQDLGAQEYLDVESSSSEHAPSAWSALEAAARRRGPWDAVVTCAAAPPAAPAAAAPPRPAAILKATAPRSAIVDLRPRMFLSDRLPVPFSIIFAASFYGYRILRWAVGCGAHTDWLEEARRTRAGLDALARLVDAGELGPVLDKVYLPQEFETALAHACSDDALGTTVVRFP